MIAVNEISHGKNKNIKRRKYETGVFTINSVLLCNRGF